MHNRPQCHRPVARTQSNERACHDIFLVFSPVALSSLIFYSSLLRWLTWPPSAIDIIFDYLGRISDWLGVVLTTLYVFFSHQKTSIYLLMLLDWIFNDYFDFFKCFLWNFKLFFGFFNNFFDIVGDFFWKSIKKTDTTDKTVRKIPFQNRESKNTNRRILSARVFNFLTGPLYLRVRSLTHFWYTYIFYTDISNFTTFFDDVVI